MHTFNAVLGGWSCNKPLEIACCSNTRATIDQCCGRESRCIWRQFGRISRGLSGARQIWARDKRILRSQRRRASGFSVRTKEQELGGQLRSGEANSYRFELAPLLFWRKWRDLGCRSVLVRLNLLGRIGAGGKALTLSESRHPCKRKVLMATRLMGQCVIPRKRC